MIFQFCPIFAAILRKDAIGHFAAQRASEIAAEVESETAAMQRAQSVKVYLELHLNLM